MKKKLVSVLLAGVMTVGMLAGCGSSKGESTGKSKDYDLTLYSVMTTDPDFDEWLKNVEDATGLNLSLIHIFSPDKHSLKIVKSRNE